MSGRDTVGQPHVRPNHRLKPAHAALNGRTLLHVRGADDQPYDAIDAVDATGRRIFVRVDSAESAVWLAASLLKYAANATGTTHNGDSTQRELVALIRKYTGYTTGAPASSEGGK